jgi:hypothetical protein
MHRQPLALVAFLLMLAMAGTASAQRYGQNPAPMGVFVPLADSPVPAGTTSNGTATTNGTNSTTSATTNMGSLALGNGMQLSLSGGSLNFTVDQNLNPGLFSLINAFGQIDFSFTTLLGTQVNIQSTITNNLATVNITFGNQFISATNPNQTGNSSSLPNANPVDDPNGGIDGSPGNPLGGT